jgi:hypothetical protein
MPNSYSNEAARAAGPDVDEASVELEEAIRALAKAMLDHYGFESMPPHIAKQVAEVLDLDPPGFDPATEGP